MVRPIEHPALHRLARVLVDHRGQPAPQGTGTAFIAEVDQLSRVFHEEPVAVWSLAQAMARWLRAAATN